MARAKKSNVVRLGGVSLSINEPCPDIVEMLTQLLREAKTGAIIGLGVALVAGNRSCDYWIAAGSAPTNLLLASATRLQFDLLKGQ